MHLQFYTSFIFYAILKNVLSTAGDSQKEVSRSVLTSDTNVSKTTIRTGDTNVGYQFEQLLASIKSMNTAIQNNIENLKSEMNKQQTEFKSFVKSIKTDIKSVQDQMKKQNSEFQLSEKSIGSEIDSFKNQMNEQNVAFKSFIKHRVGNVRFPLKAHELHIPNISASARWSQNGTIVAGGGEYGKDMNALWGPNGFVIDDDEKTIIIADHNNNRVLEWKTGATNGELIAGGCGPGYVLESLDGPSDVLIDKETASLIICDKKRLQVLQWSRAPARQGHVLIDNIGCCGLSMDAQRSLYVSVPIEHEVRRYQLGGNMENSTIVAGGNGVGSSLNQLNMPCFIFVDQQQTVYVSDASNHRVMKWNKNAKEGIVVVGGQGEGDSLSQLSNPRGLFVDTLETVYVVENGNNRVTRWPKKAKEGTIVLGNDAQLSRPVGLSFDHENNIYVSQGYPVGDEDTIRRFSIQ